MNARPAYADPIELREQAMQSRQDELWADRECFAEYAGECLAYVPRREVTRFDRTLGIVKTGEVREAVTDGLPLIALAQSWRAAKDADRDAIAARFGKLLLASIETYIEEVAQEDV